MKKIIFTISLIIYSFGAYAQSCAGISGSTVAKSYGYKSCVDSNMGRSVLNTVKADTVEVTKLTVTNLTDGIIKSVGDVLTPAVPGTDYVAPSSIGSQVIEADATNFVSNATAPYYKNKNYVGSLLKCSFSNGTTGWTSGGSGTTWALSGTSLQCSGGGGASDYTNFYRYNTFQGIATGGQSELIFTPTVNASNANEGIAIALKSNNGVGDILARVDLSNTATRGQLTIYRIISGTASLLSTSSANISFTTGVDNLCIRITKRPNNTADAKLINLTTGASVNTLFLGSIGSTFVYKLAVYHFGGTQLISGATLKNTTNKSKKTILIGDSVSNGYGVYFVASVKGDASMEAGSGASSSDLVSVIDDLINSGGANAIVMIGMNDAISSVSSSDYMSNVRKIVNAVKEAGINPIICYVTPSGDSGRNVFIQSYNTALLAEYTGVYTIIDTYSPLSVGNNLTGLLDGAYDSGDGIHLNATGYQLLSSTVAHGAIAAVPSNTPSLNETQTFTGTNTFANTVHSAIGIGTSPSAIFHIAQNFTGPANATTGVGVRIDAATYTDNTSSGTVGNKRVHVLGVPTLAATGTVTYTNATTWYFPVPAAGTNVTNTNLFSIETQGNILNGGNLWFSNAGAATGILVPTATRFRILTGASNDERFRITSATGFVGIGTTAPTPNSNLHVDGSFALAYSAKTTTYAISSTDYLIDCTSGTFTVTLPTAASITGRLYVIKNSGAGTITVATTSSQTIDGVTTKSLSVQYGGIEVMSNGTNWVVTRTF